jgi:hypothetical protein
MHSTLSEIYWLAQLGFGNIMLQLIFTKQLYETRIDTFLGKGYGTIPPYCVFISSHYPLI